MPKFIVEASEEVFYWKEVEARDYDHAIQVFNETMTNHDMVDGQGFTIEQVSEVENV
jgi:hypothetical protein